MDYSARRPQPHGRFPLAGFHDHAMVNAYSVADLGTTNQFHVGEPVYHETQFAPLSPDWFNNGIASASFDGSGDMASGPFENLFYQGDFNVPLRFEHANVGVPAMLNQEYSDFLAPQDPISNIVVMDGVQDSYNTWPLDDEAFPGDIEVIANQQNFLSGLTLSQNHLNQGSDEYCSNNDALGRNDIERISLHQRQHQDPIPVEFRTYRPRPKQKCARKSRGKFDWEVIRERSYHPYMILNHTAEQVAFEMSSMFGYEMAVSTFKNKIGGWDEFRKNSTAQPESQRDRRRYLQKSPKVPKISNPLHLSRRIPSNRSPQPVSIQSIPVGLNDDQQILLSSMCNAISALVKSRFGTKKGLWKPDIINLIRPAGAMDSAAHWQLVFDKCIGIVTLSEGRLGGKVQFMLGQFFHALDTATQSCDPVFLLQFWKVCVNLWRIKFPGRTKAGPFVFLRHFLQRLKAGFFRSCRNKHDGLVMFVNSLIEILQSEPRTLKATLGWTYSQPIKALGDMIGKEHVIVLGMVADCTTHWNSMFQVEEAYRAESNKISERELLESRFQAILQSCGLKEVETRIGLLYHYTNAVSNGKYVSETVGHHANELRSLTLDRCRTDLQHKNLQYTLTSRAFASSTDLLAKYHLEMWEMRGREKGRSPYKISALLIEAIEILRLGDIECLVQAVHCSKRLAVWFKTFDPDDQHRTKGQTKGKKT